MAWLEPLIEEVDVEALAGRALPALPVPVAWDTVRVQAVIESGEPLDPVGPPFNVYRPYESLGLLHCPRRLTLRRAVIKRLSSARLRLPPDFDLVLMDGWRSRSFQKELFEYYGERVPNIDGYVADPSSTVIPGHVTGGAVDLTLSYRGRPLALGSDYDEFSGEAHLASMEHLAPEDPTAALRRLLGMVLTEEGFAPYPLEWWHWSYGDQRWAAQFGLPNAIYGAMAEV